MSEVETVSYDLKVPKESKDVVDAVVGIIEDIKAGKGALSSAQENFDKLVAAVNGFAQIPAEAKSEYKDELIGYFTHKLTEALLA